MIERYSGTGHLDTLHCYGSLVGGQEPGGRTERLIADAMLRLNRTKHSLESRGRGTLKR